MTLVHSEACLKNCAIVTGRLILFLSSRMCPLTAIIYISVCQLLTTVENELNSLTGTVKDIWLTLFL